MDDVIVIADWADALKLILQRMNRLEHKIERIKDLLVSVTERFDALAATITGLSTDVDTLLQTAITGHDADLARIEALTALSETLAANDTADAAQIASLNEIIAQMQATATQEETDMIARIDVLNNTTTDLDARVKAFSTPPVVVGPDPEPEPAPVVEP